MKLPPNYGAAYVARIRRAVRGRREGAQGAARSVLLRRASASATSCSSPIASIRPRRRSRCSSTTSGPRCCRSWRRGDDRRTPRGAATTRWRSTRSPTIRTASTCAARPSSPSDHLPGAASHPVLDDAERAAVGTLHAQASAFAARRDGAALVARNIARMLEARSRRSRATGRRSSTAGAAASAAARSRTC